jgi:hypothetical protein
MKFSQILRDFIQDPNDFLEPTIFPNIDTVSEGDLGQILALTLDCGAIEYYIILPLVAVF